MGAEARLLQISEEAAAIYRAFPELRRGGGGAGRGRRRAGRAPAAAAASSGGDEAAAQPRRKRRLSAAARKRISDAQKRRWAKHRQAKAKQSK